MTVAKIEEDYDGIKYIHVSNSLKHQTSNEPINLNIDLGKPNYKPLPKDIYNLKNLALKLEKEESNGTK